MTDIIDESLIAQPPYLKPGDKPKTSKVNLKQIEEFVMDLLSAECKQSKPPKAVA